MGDWGASVNYGGIRSIDSGIEYETKGIFYRWIDICNFLLFLISESEGIFEDVPRMIMECLAVYYRNSIYQHDNLIRTSIYEKAKDLENHYLNPDETLSARGIFERTGILKAYTKRPPAKSVIITLGEY